jgi:transcriptional regulator with XRE-family HTH domain
MLITAGQCRSARTLLSWSVSQLANVASVSQCDIDDFERERRVPKAATLETFQRTLEAAGAILLPHDDVRVHAASTEIKTHCATALTARPPISRGIAADPSPAKTAD